MALRVGKPGFKSYSTKYDYKILNSSGSQIPQTQIVSKRSYDSICYPNHLRQCLDKKATLTEHWQSNAMTSIHDFYSRSIHIYRRNIFTLKANQEGATMINQKMKQNKKQANPQNKNRKLILQFVFVFIAEMTWLQQFKWQRQVLTNSTTFSKLTLC